MKNKEITMYELVGLIKDNKAPKKINILEERDKGIWLLREPDEICPYLRYVEEDCGKMHLNFEYYICNNLLNTKLEILSEENEMKEMIYQKDRKRELLYNGVYKGYEFYIMNLGTHPTAYVNVENNFYLNKKDYDEIDIDVHGGLTYCEDYLHISNEKEIKAWFIGWDYAHHDDYAGYEMNMPEEIRTNGKKWTTEEIFEDVKTVIEQCINYKENDEWQDIYILGDNEEHHFMNRKNGMTQEDRRLLDSNFKTLGETLNQLIKNQKYLKERLDKNELR